MRLSRFAGVSFGEIGEVLREEWRKFFTLLMYFKAFAPAWPARTKLYRTGRKMLLPAPTVFIFLSSFAQAGTVQQISFHVVTLALMFSACIAISWFVAGVILGTIPPLLRIGRMVGLASFFACGAIAASAQTQPNLENGFKDYGSIHGSNIDSVNLTTGNWMLHSPLFADVAQRGDLGAHYFAYATSKNWQIKCTPNSTTGQTCFWVPGGTGVALERSTAISVHRTVIISAPGDGTITYEGYGYTLNGPDGASHQMYGIPGTEDANGDPTIYESLDTTGYHVTLSNQDSNGVWATVTMMDRQGNQYLGNFGPYQNCPKASSGRLPRADSGNVAPVIDDTPLGDRYCSQNAFMSLITDANGNQMTYFTPQNQVAGQDTAGRSQPLESGAPTSDYSGCVSRFTVSYAFINYYTGPGGASQQVKSCYAAVPFQTAFNATTAGVSVLEAQNVSSNYNSTLGGYMVLQLVTLVLADGSKWTFDYDSYLEVTSVGLPTGGSISLTWTTINFANCNPPDPTYLSRAVASRTLNDNNGHSYTWNYTWGTPSNGTLVNTVTDALSNDSVHTFTALSNEGSGNGCFFYETRTQDYQGTGTGRQLLKQVDTTYSSMLFTVATSAISAVGNVVPTSVQTTVYPSGKVSLVTKSYDSGLGTNAPIFGNVTKELDYDWGQGSPGPLLRETDTTYQWQVDSRYLTANLLDLPASVVVKTASGTKMAETDYVYDESAYLTASNISTQHGSAPNPVRGNLTTASRWLNTSTSPVVSHTNWYDTGEVYQAIDPLGHTTTHSYDPFYVGAYATQTCSPTTSGVAHCVSGTYDFNTGVLTSLTNENATTQASGNTPGDSAHTSNYTYDFMFRIISAQAPPDPANNGLHATTSFNFSAPNSFPVNVQRTKSVTTALSDSATSFFDGLGRGYKGQHTLPNGAATVDTTFDLAGHPATVSNPYFSTSDPTFGTITNAYDALDRVTQTTKQDGSISSVAYNVITGAHDAVPGANFSGDCTDATDEAGKQRRACVDGLGRLVMVVEPNPGAGATTATGSVTINGNEQSTGGAATSGSATITITGNEQSGQYCPAGHCHTLWDAGTVAISVAGFAAKTVTYSQSDTAATVAWNLSCAFHNDTSGPADASCPQSAGSSTSVVLTARVAGSATNYSFTTSSATGDTTGTFGGPSFFAGPASGAFTGGHDAGASDSGNITVTVNATNYTVAFGAGDTGSAIASRLASAMSGDTVVSA